MAQVKSLIGRRPDLTGEELVRRLVVPSRFVEVDCDSYIPDPAFPSQTHAQQAARACIEHARSRRRPHKPTGLYFDGGYGVGKTHLLAAIATGAGEKAMFCTFMQLTAVVGVLGFAAARDHCAQFRVLCIDEFELDDVGNTMLVTRLMRELSDRGVIIAATSNTPPGELGQGRFAAEDFLREIQSLSAIFEVVRIEGADYRQHAGTVSPLPVEDSVVQERTCADNATCDDWNALLADLSHVHPAWYGAYVEGVATVGLTGITPVPDEAHALRIVAFVDRLYDQNTSVVFSGIPIEKIFSEQMMRGGYRKKYLRTLSRLGAMAVSTSAEATD